MVATFPTLYIVDPQALFEIKRVLRPGGRLIVLNAAWITGKSLPDRLMNFVFRIPNQTPSLDQELREFIHPFLEAGLQAGLRFIELPDSQLMVILAIREETNDFYHSIEPGT